MKVVQAAFISALVLLHVGPRPCCGQSEGISLGSWHNLAPIANAPRKEHGAVAISETTVALIAGVIPNGTFPEPTDVLQLYDIPSDTWRTAAPVPRPVTHPNIAAFEGKIYLLGALFLVNRTTWRAVADCWVYDPAKNAWEELEAMPAGEGRGSSATDILGDTIYVAGGMTFLGPREGPHGTVDTVSAFNTTTGKWTMLPAAARVMPGLRNHGGGAIIDRTFYVVGGRDQSQSKPYDDVFALNLDDMESGWVTKKGKMPTARSGLAVAAVNKKIYTFGGQGNPVNGTEGIFNQTEVYDTVTDSWMKLGPMRLPRHGTCAVPVGGKIYIPGGGISDGANSTDTLDVFTP
jgi:N-acetylneuraminic acid mutarotase